ncbi:MAG: POTRA domain-containing protein [Myxococcota bacterium]
MFFPFFLPALLAAASTEAARSPAAGADGFISGIEVRLSPSDETSEVQLRSHLHRYVGRPLSESIAKEAQQRLSALPQYERARCRIQESDQRHLLRCSLAIAPQIGRIRFEGLPPQLLEGDLRRRLFIRTGEPLGSGAASNKGRLQRQRERLEQYLHRLGYFDAKVRIETPRVTDTNQVEMTIRITNGRFLRVSHVDIEGETVLPKDELEGAFRYMCLGGDGWLTFLETWRLDCFTPARLQAVTERLVLQLQRRGYPNANLRVSVQRAPLTENSGTCGANERQEGKRPPTRDEPPQALGSCVSLHVKVEPGPRTERWLLLATEATAQPTRLGSGEEHAGEWLADVFRRGSVRQSMSRALQLAADLPLQSSADAEISATNLRATAEREEGLLLTLAPLETAQSWLETHLAENGYPAATVDLIEEDNPQTDPPTHRVTFQVHPGAPSAIRGIRFLGNHAFPSSTLEAQLTTLRRRSLRSSGFFSMKQLEDERRALETFYESNGYLDARISARTEQHLDDLQAIFYINEGSRYLVKTLRVRGGEAGLLPSILPLLAHCRGGRASNENRVPITVGDCEGAPLQPAALERDAAVFTKAYAARGYPYVHATVRIASDWDPAGATLLIELTDTRLDPITGTSLASTSPPRVTLGEVFIIGNHRTSRESLLRESGLPESGDVLTPVNVAHSMGRLRRTGLFAKVDYRYLGKEFGDEDLSLLVQVEERPAGTVDFSASFSTQDLMELSAEWRDRNLLGRMLDASLQADLGLFIGRRSNLELALQWPRILGTDINLRIHPRSSYSDHPTARLPSTPGSLGPISGLDAYQGVARRRIFSAGMKVGVDWIPQIPSLAGMQAGIDYELYTAWDDPNAGRISPFDQYTYGGWTFSLPSRRAVSSLDGLIDVFQQTPTQIASLGPRIKIHRVINPLDPSGGWSSDAAIAVSHPLIGASQPSLLLHTGARWYKSLHADWTLALHGSAWGGVTQVAAGSRSQLLQPGFIALGGDRTVRGYSFDAPFGVPMLAAEVASGQRTGLIPLLGAVTNTELRWTAVRGLFLGDLKLAGFIDAGFVTDDTNLPWTSSVEPWLSPAESLDVLLRATPQRVGVGVGAGLRYVMPIGPLALDLAFSPLTLSPQVHLQFGYSF